MVGTAYDAIVVGAGLFGAASAAALAKDGRKVLLIEAFEPHHALGSSHGQTRITRSLNESPELNQTAARSLEMMREMEKEPGDIVRPMPAIFIADDSSNTSEILQQVWNDANVQLRQLEREEVADYGLQLKQGQVALLDETTATFNPAVILDRLYEQIQHNGGEIAFRSPVASWQQQKDYVEVETADGDLIRAEKLVVATGSWTPHLLKQGNANRKMMDCLADAMQVKRVPLFYFDYPEHMPDVIPLCMLEDAEAELYAMPEIGEGGKKWLKMGFHQVEQVTTPDEVDRVVYENEIAHAKAYMEELTGVEMPVNKAIVCLYATANDKELPIIGALPGSDRVILASFGGGNCAKHALAFGEIVSDLVQEKTPAYAIEAFSPARVTAQRYLRKYQAETNIFR